MKPSVPDENAEVASSAVFFRVMTFPVYAAGGMCKCHSTLLK